MSTRPRTREHFPRMKVRGYGRRHRKPKSALSWAKAAGAASQIAELMTGVAKRITDAFTEAFAPLTRRDVALVPIPVHTVGELFRAVRSRPAPNLPRDGWRDLITAEALARHADLRVDDLPWPVVPSLDRLRMDDLRDILQVWVDPTHGTVDIDVQLMADRIVSPGAGVGQRVAIERTLQDRKAVDQWAK